MIGLPGELIVKPLLLPKSKLLLATRPLPDMIMSLNAAQFAFSVVTVSVRVRSPNEFDATSTTALGLPFRFKVDTVWLLERISLFLPAIVRTLNVFVPVIVKIVTPVWPLTRTVEYVSPPPVNMEPPPPAPVMFPVKSSIEELALKVKFVTMLKFQIAVLNDVPVNVHIPLPRLIVRAPVPEQIKPAIALSVTFSLFVFQAIVPVNAPQVIDWNVPVPP